jgi:hypothetical protein
MKYARVDYVGLLPDGNWQSGVESLEIYHANRVCVNWTTSGATFGWSEICEI